uniref:Testis-specific Y-encoded-like protein 1 n=1 Tax=Sinocyclocheilus rhinocerous TaxID=307959 RepID=A0A673MGA2_9TELE
MSTNSDSGQPSETNQRKRSVSPSVESDSTLPKQAKVSDEEPRNDSREDAEPEKVGNDEPKHGSEHPEDAKEKDTVILNEADAQESTGQACGGESERQSSDSAAIAAAEALASLTGGDADEDRKEMPCSSKKASREKSRDKSNRPSCSQSERRTEAAAADSSSSLLLCEDREDPEQASFVDDEEEDDDSLPGSSSTASSSVASDNDDNEDGECAIVSVKMAPEVRQSVALLAQVQMRLDALEKKGARLHQRLEMKLSRQRRPHLDQRGAITQAIPGFWVTALLNHPLLSAQIDETDEDALSYMTNLEVIHFFPTPLFMNVKQITLGHIYLFWNLVGSGEPRRTSQGVYQSFFHWFSDHSNPGRDDIAQILKDDLYRNPLRYYLTPLWEPRENGSRGPKPQGNNNGDECVIISDSDEDEEKSQNLGQEDEDDDQVGGSEENDRDEGESSYEERDEEEVDVEEVEESRDSSGCEVREQGQEEEDIDVDEEKS